MKWILTSAQNSVILTILIIEIVLNWLATPFKRVPLLAFWLAKIVAVRAIQLYSLLPTNWHYASTIDVTIDIQIDEVYVALRKKNNGLYYKAYTHIYKFFDLLTSQRPVVRPSLFVTTIRLFVPFVSGLTDTVYGIQITRGTVVFPKSAKISEKVFQDLQADIIVF